MPLIFLQLAQGKVPLVEPIFFLFTLLAYPHRFALQQRYFKKTHFLYLFRENKHGRVSFPRALIVAAIVTNSPRSRGVRDPICEKEIY